MITLEQHYKYIQENKLCMSFENREKIIYDNIDLWIQKNKESQEILNNYLEDNGIVYTEDGLLEYTIQDNESFVSVFDKNNYIQRELCNHWFISKEGTLLTVKNGKISLVREVLHDINYPNNKCYKFVHPVTKRTKSIEKTTLLCLVFNPNCLFGLSKEISKKCGIYSFGGNESIFNLQCHHKISRQNDISKLYDIDNMQILTYYEHSILNNISILVNSGSNLNIFNEIDILKRILQAPPETQDKPYIVWIPQSYDSQGNIKDSKRDCFYQDVSKLKMEVPQATFQPIILE